MKKIILFVVFIMIVGSILMYKYFGDIAGFKGGVNTPESVKALNTFLDAHEEEYVVLSLQLSESVRNQIIVGMKKNPHVLFRVSDPDNPKKSINYILKQLEGGKRLFILDEEKGTLEGLFKTYKEVTSQGKTFTYLVPTNPVSVDKK